MRCHSLQSTLIIAELAGKKPADFIDHSQLREVEKEGFFAWAKR